MEGIKWLLFDLDNTLLDFDEGAQVAIKQTLAHYNLYDQADELIRSYHEINDFCWDQFERGLIAVQTLKEQRFAMFVDQNQLDIEPQVINRFYLTQLSQQTKEIVGARVLLDHTVARFNLVLVTNGFAEVQHPRILKSAFRNYFKHIIISEEIGHSKPAREFFDHAFNKMGSPMKEHVMIIGDSLSSDIKGGAQYGIRTCWFNLQGITNQSGIQPDYTVRSLAELSSILPG